MDQLHPFIKLRYPLPHQEWMRSIVSIDLPMEVRSDIFSPTAASAAALTFKFLT